MSRCQFLHKVTKKITFQGWSTKGNNGIAAHVRTARWLAPGSHAVFQTYLTMIEVCYIRHFDTMTKCQVFFTVLLFSPW